MKKIMFLLALAIISLSVSAQKYKGSERSKSAEEILNEQYCTGLFKSTDGTILDVASDMSARSYFNILDWLQGRVAGLSIYPGRSGLRIPVIRGAVPGVFIDEMPVSLNYVDMINVNDIAMVKVIKMPFYGSFNGGGGAIAIYTLGNENEEEDSAED